MTQDEKDLEVIKSQMDGLYLTLAKIRNMASGVEVVPQKDKIIFIYASDILPCPFKSGIYTKISPSEIEPAERFVRASDRQWLRDKANEFKLLEKKAFILRKKNEMSKDFE